MSKGIIAAGDSIVMIENLEVGVIVETYQTRVELVMSLLNNGSLGGGPKYHGCQSHKNALRDIRDYATTVLRVIRDAEKGEKSK